MFTGIVEAQAKIIRKDDHGLVVERPPSFDDVKPGASIAVSGACLSVVSFDAASLSFDVVPETWAKTKLGKLSEEDFVNLERAMRADGRFDGHIVQGHIEGVGEVTHVKKSGDDVRAGIRLSSDLLSQVVAKGSITLDGVSLTVASLENDGITVALIPHTLQSTTLGKIRQGDAVNVETDILAKHMRSINAYARH